MTRGLALLLSSMLVAAGPETESETPAAWQYNSRGRTDSGIALQEQGEMTEATRAFATALGLSPGDPLLQFNAGTAGLLAADPRAVELLQAAAERAPAHLQPSIYYNLGNAHMTGEDFPAAIDSFKESLRREPGNLDVKHNLELAMRRLQQQQQQQQQQDEDQEQDEQDQQQEQQQQQQQNPEQEEQQQQQQQDPNSPLPDFEDQPDMTAEQAAAILEAVENLEREQRQKQALEMMKRATGDRDW